jgi:hypothetical protein
MLVSLSIRHVLNVKWPDEIKMRNYGREQKIRERNGVGSTMHYLNYKNAY